MHLSRARRLTILAGLIPAIAGCLGPHGPAKDSPRVDLSVPVDSFSFGLRPWTNGGWMYGGPIPVRLTNHTPQPVGLRHGCDHRVQGVFVETQTDSGWVSGDTEEVACVLQPIIIRPGQTWSDSIGYGGCYQRSNCFGRWYGSTTTATMRIFLYVYGLEGATRLTRAPVAEVVSNPFVVTLVHPR